MSDLLYADVKWLFGVGEVKAKALNRIKIYSVHDLIYTFPRAYQNRGKIESLKEAADANDNMPHALELTIATEPKLTKIRQGMSIVRFKAFDCSGTCEITYFNQDYLKNGYPVGGDFRFFGKVTKVGKQYKMSSPISEALFIGSDIRAIHPVYPLGRGLTQKFMATTIKNAMAKTKYERYDPVPPFILQNENLCSLDYALENIHNPDSFEALNKAIERLVFDEIFTMSLALCSAKSEKVENNLYKAEFKDLATFEKALPYELTNAQKRSINEIVRDMSAKRPMNRILIGDVGSGKTIVAAMAAYIMVKNGYQVAIMAPTEILANQHYNDLKAIFNNFNMNVGLLTGGLTAKNKKLVYEDIKNGNVDIVIGTHALISEGVEFKNLALVITDEQHRFGVNQRAMLAEKSKQVHTLVMSATPIPRTLSLAMYGDLDISKIDEMPKGRQKVDTFVVDESYRDRLNEFIRKQVKEGHQVYIVCPAVEEQEKEIIPDDTEDLDSDIFNLHEDEEPQLKSAVKYAEDLSAILPDCNVSFVHGKLKPSQKDEVMQRFAKGEIDVLVSTTVIEVGVNVPNATLMIVENAERFGLSQLHQLRGRVGRGKAKSYCILVSDSHSENAKKRLSVMKATNNGFEIAEQDLILRGPGDFFESNGEIRQSGGLRLKLAAGCTNAELISRAIASARLVIDDDPYLTSEKNEGLRDWVINLIENSKNKLN